MHEQYKLSEAGHFLQRMNAERDNPEIFRYELSAFLGAARSVLQYALEDAKSKSGGQRWYEQAVAAEPLISFCKDQRDSNIHVIPISPANNWRTEERELLELDDDMYIRYPHTTSVNEYRFSSWNGDETVAELSSKYLNILRNVVAEGVAKNYIAG